MQVIYKEQMTNTSKNMQTVLKGQKRSIVAWCVYDWGNSAFSTVIITFVFSVYFARGIVGDAIQGSALWSYAIAASGFVIAILGPLLGAVADHYGARKRWLAVFGMVCVLATALLWLGLPDASSAHIVLILSLVVLANIGFELSLVFSNAILPHIAPNAMLGRISGWSWGLGYIGGLFCLALALFGLVGMGDHAPWLALPREHSEHVRASALLTSLWYFLFMLPLLLFTHDSAKSGLSLRSSLGRGITQLKQSLHDVRHHGHLVRFLIASALYRDGLNTLFAVGGLYAAGTFGMDFQEILIFAIGLNVAAGLGAGGFAFLDDHFGSKSTILTALAGLIALGGIIIFIHDKIVFMGLAMALGIFIGPAQAASRTLAARLAPPEMEGQTYGLYAFTGKSIAFLGPLAFGTATFIFDSQRAGIATILLFWIAGMVLLLKVREQKA